MYSLSFLTIKIPMGMNQEPQAIHIFVGFNLVLHKAAFTRALIVYFQVTCNGSDGNSKSPGIHQAGDQSSSSR